MRTTVRGFIPVALIAASISACADAPTSAVRFSPSLPSQHLVPIVTPEVEFVALCKAGPVGTYTFDATATHPVLRDAATGAYSLTSATYTIVVTAGSTIDVGGTSIPGACYSFSNTRGTHNHIALAGGTVDATVTVVETGIPAGIDFDHVVVYQLSSGTVSSSSSTTNSASGRLGGTVAQPAMLGANIVFYNVPEPPPAGCTYTKGWYQNKNGAPTVIAVDGRTIAQAQAIFAATPGQPGGVTWGTNNKPNSLLNLYQQLLAALNNLGGDANYDDGPAAVTSAITAALAGTGGTGLNITTTLSATEIGNLTTTLASFNEGAFVNWPHCGWLTN